MRNSGCRTAGLGRALCIVASIIITLTSTTVSAQVNSWIKPASGNWDDASSWSLGALPNSSQSVLITNSNWKAVAINPATPINFPGAMTVNNLSIDGPTNTVNTLLLNFIGTTPPLHVLNDFNIEPNGHLQILNSGLRVDKTFNVKGPFDQEGGELVLTNSSTSAMQIEGGQFNLTNGVVTGKVLYLGGTNDAYVTQASGLVSLDWLGLGLKISSFGTAGGTYTLQSGWLIVNVWEGIGQHGFGTLNQSGGTNSATMIQVGPGSYLKTGGGLFAGEVGILTSGASLTHAGGSATITNLLKLNAQGATARFNMLGGSLTTPRIELQSAGLVTQSNGTVNVANELFMEENRSSTMPNSYHLHGGNLFTHKTTISFSSYSSTSFIQSGGTHVVTNTLWINGTSSIYQWQGGTINARNIVLTGNIYPQPPQFHVLGAPPYSLTNETISLTGGAVVIQDSAQRFGSLTMPLDSGINLAGNTAILRFADCHTNDWRGQLTWRIPQLAVYNWNGSTNGGGTDQLSFGNNSSALTASQLAQIQFVNPAGFAPGTYPARILSTGEVVPTSAPTLGFHNNGANLELNWPTNFILQGATNVVGPYVDITNATSPYSFNKSQFPVQFFRLRQ